MINNIMNKYIEETITSTDVANYDQKIGDEGNSQEDFIEIILKNNIESTFKIIKKVASSNNVDIQRPRKDLEKGDIIKILGPTEEIRKIESQLIEMGIR